MSTNLAERSKKYAEEAEAFYQHAHALRLKAEKESEMWGGILRLTAKVAEKLTKLPFIEVVNSFEQWLDTQPRSSEVNHKSPEYAEYLRLKRVGRELEAELEERHREIPVQDDSKEAKGALLFSAELKERGDKPETLKDHKPELELSASLRKMSPHKGG